MNIDEILNEMENMLLDAARLPFTNKRVLEEDDFAKLIDELREALPSDLSDAKRIINERQRILDDAQKEAQNIVDQAKHYVLKLTDENIISQQAQEHANEMILQAKNSARELEKDSIVYANDVFERLESNLQRALEIIKAGHNELQQQKNSRA